eukprot:Trichotokara_eunicae@DN5895_c0_g2_i2.p1
MDPTTASRPATGVAFRTEKENGLELSRVNELEGKVKVLERENDVLLTNMSCLFSTAKEEIERRTVLVEELETELQYLRAEVHEFREWKKKGKQKAFSKKTHQIGPVSQCRTAPDEVASGGGGEFFVRGGWPNFPQNATPFGNHGNGFAGGIHGGGYYDLNSGVQSNYQNDFSVKSSSVQPNYPNDFNRGIQSNYLKGQPPPPPTVFLSEGPPSRFSGGGGSYYSQKNR